MSEARGHSVFEIVHKPRQEIYVSFTREPMFQLAELLRRRPPEAIRHWDLVEADPIRSIEFGLSESDARAFVQNYVKTSLPAGWRFLTDAIEEAGPAA